MPLPALVILVSAAALAVAGIIWLLATGFTPRLPRGSSQTVTSDGITLHVLWAKDPFSGNPSDPDREVDADLASDCHAAVLKAAEAWSKAQLEPADAPFATRANAFHELREARVVFLSPRLFDQLDGTAAIADHANALQTRTPQRIGRGCPIFYIRESFIRVAHGSLCVHEALHVLATAAGMSVEQNHRHGERRLWSRTKDDGSIESDAYQSWLSERKEAP